MKRLTQKDDQGNWSLKGVAWSELFEGQTITKEVCEKLYGALWKLMEYEDAELDPQQVLELKERDTAKKPMQAGDSKIRYTYVYRCPNCGGIFSGINIADFCYHCGQRLRWED